MKPGYWSGVRDFVADNNGTVTVRQMQMADWMPPLVGGLGPRPDYALMLTEPSSRVDELADRMGWDGSARIIAHEIEDRMQAIRRKQWLEDQVVESLKEGWADVGDPTALMTLTEREWFAREIKTRKKSRFEREQRERQRYQASERRRRYREEQVVSVADALTKEMHRQRHIAFTVLGRAHECLCENCVLERLAASYKQNDVLPEKQVDI